MTTARRLLAVVAVSVCRAFACVGLAGAQDVDFSGVWVIDSFRGADGTSTQAQKLRIPGDPGNDVPAISSDGKYLFMRRGLNQFSWVETALIEKPRPKGWEPHMPPAA